MMRRKISLLLIACFIHGSVFALVIPGQAAKDPRIQTAVYDREDIFKVFTRIGKSTLIQLEEGERITGEPSGLGMGDAAAWSLSVRGSNIFLKPIAEMPETNMNIVTNRRTYSFILAVADRGVPTTYVLNFIYPDTIAKNNSEQEKKQQLAESLQANKNGGKQNINRKYLMWGNTELAPTAAWDNGQFTYFKYASSKEMPAFYKILSDGKESLVNSHIEDDTLVVHDTAKVFMLRLGDSVLGVENQAYSPDGFFNSQGTTLENNVRIDRGVR
jgi:type IV secretion system protein VirB9